MSHDAEAHRRISAILARLDALEEAKQPDPWPTIEALITRIEELEEARIDSQEAPESVVNVSEVSQEPGNATEAHSGSEWPLLLTDPHDPTGRIIQTSDAEVAAALRVYRKVQACRRHDDGVCVSVDAANWYETAAGLLAWLKEGEA